MSRLFWRCGEGTFTPRAEPEGNIGVGVICFQRK